MQSGSKISQCNEDIANWKLLQIFWLQNNMTVGHINIR